MSFRRGSAALFCAFALILAGAQKICAQALTLPRCREAARELNATDSLKTLLENDLRENLHLIRTNYIPVARGYGHAMYQSDSPDPASLSDLPFEFYSPPKFQFHVGVMITQTIYAGGSRKVRYDISRVDSQLEQLSLDRAALESDGAVDEVYLGALLAREKSEILQVQKDALETKLRSVTEAWEAGAAYRTDVLRAEAALSEVNAQIAGNDAELDALMNVLGLLTGLKTGPETELAFPSPDEIPAVEEDFSLQECDLQQQKVELNLKLSRAQALPRISAFGTMGFGQWPLDFFRREPDVYGLVGINLSIPLTGWQDVVYRKRLLSNASDKIEIQRSALELQKYSALKRYDAGIEKFSAMEASAAETVEKYELLLEETEALSERGVVPLNDYITAVQELAAAKIKAREYSILKVREQLFRKQYVTSK